MSSEKLIGLFPTPFMKIDGFMPAALLDAFSAKAQGLQKHENTATDLLAHTHMINPMEDETCTKLCELVSPHVVRFGEVLFADRLNWCIKEMWLNVLQPGGSQFMHTHANSFVSGIVYITRPEAGSSTVFRKPGGGEFVFKHDVPEGHYSSDTWVVPEVNAGDLVLYPSYLMHGVPPNEGPERITVAFNAIPDHLDSLGYRIRFAP